MTAIRGRSAEITFLDDDRVLRRDLSGRDCTAQADLLRHLHTCGYPVPRVLAAQGPDLVLERVHGPDLLSQIAAGDIGWVKGFELLGRLHRRLSDVPVPEGLPDLGDDVGAAPAPTTPTVISHLDFHPGNVLCGSAGAIVIDWEAARRADRALDVATTVVLILTAPEADRFPYAHRVEGLRAFAAAAEVDPLPAMKRAGRRRLHDRNVGADERDRVCRFLAGGGHGWDPDDRGPR